MSSISQLICSMGNESKAYPGRRGEERRGRRGREGGRGEERRGEERGGEGREGGEEKRGEGRGGGRWEKRVGVGEEREGHVQDMLIALHRHSTLGRYDHREERRHGGVV